MEIAPHESGSNLVQVSDRFLWGDAASTCLETLLFRAIRKSDGSDLVWYMGNTYPNFNSHSEDSNVTLYYKPLILKPQTPNA